MNNALHTLHCVVVLHMRPNRFLETTSLFSSMK